jgi:hypothetical protein
MTFTAATHWRARAEEARALANEIPDILSQRLVRKMAGDYEQLADLADERDSARPRIKRHSRPKRRVRRAAKKERRV